MIPFIDRDTVKGEPCVKCGSFSGWEGPRYQSASGERYTLGEMKSSPVAGEHLTYRCNNCGYFQKVACKDAQDVRRDLEKSLA